MAFYQPTSLTMTALAAVVFAVNNLVTLPVAVQNQPTKQCLKDPFKCLKTGFGIAPN